MVAAIALANGLNANYLRRWIKERREQAAGGGVAELVVAKMPAPSALVPVVIQAPEDVVSGDIRLDIRRGPTTVQLAWPVDHAAMLGVVLKELLR